IEVADAFGAARRVDHVDDFALRDGIVRARRLADVAVDTKLVDLEGHGCSPGAGGDGLHPRTPSLESAADHLVSTNTYSTPAGFTASSTRALSTASPMNSRRTPFREPGSTFANAPTTSSAIIADSGDPKATRLPSTMPRCMAL